MNQQHIRCAFCDAWVEDEFRLGVHNELEHPVCVSCNEKFKVRMIVVVYYVSSVTLQNQKLFVLLLLTFSLIFQR